MKVASQAQGSKPFRAEFDPNLGSWVILFHLIGGYAFWRIFIHHYSASAWIMFAVMWAVSLMGVTLGYHRLSTHSSYQCSDWLKKIFSGCAATSGEGTQDRWTPTHMQHHAFSDGVGDPHTPTMWGGGWKGLLWSHVGWVICKPVPIPAGSNWKVPEDVLQDPIALWQEKYYLLFLALGIAIPGLIAGWDGILLAGFGRIVVCWHITWCVNSLGHMIGDEPVKPDGTVKLTGDDARNLPLQCFYGLVGILTMGEGFHGNHHAYQNCPFLGLRWYQLDPGKWLLKFLKWLHLVWKLKPVPQLAAAT